jgi:hypothetical protein
MTQQIINLGSGPDTQTGDSLYTAFTKVNDNFTELYSVFDGNGISYINANVIISNNVVVSSNIRTGNIAAYGNIETIGYIVTAGAFYPNGVAIGGIGSVSSNILPLTTNLYSIGSQSLQFSEGYFSNNVTISGANVTVRNGLLYVNGQLTSGNYGNSNVAAYLPVYGGNISATVTTANQPYITQVGTISNLTANIARIFGNLVVEGNLSVDGNVTFFNVDNLLVEDPIITLNTGANGAPLTFDNGFDSGIKTYYFDTQNREAFFGRKDSTGYFEYYSNVVSDIGNIVSGTYGTIKTGNLILTEQANVTGNVSASYFYGNGRFLDGIDATSIQNGNSNVKVYANGNVSVTTAGTNTWNFGTAGQLTVPGPISGLGNAKLDFTTYGANTAYLTTTNDDSTALFMGLVSADLYAHTNILIRANTGGTSQTWTFNEDGTLTLPGNLITSSNVIANYFLGNFVGNISGNISAAGANTQILFNDNNTVNAVPGLTFNKSSNLLTVGGTVNALSVNVAGYNVIDSNGNVVTARLQDSGVIAGTYGNASAVPVITVDDKGRITVASTTAVAGVNNVTYDPVASNLTIFTSAGTNYSVDLNVGTADVPTFSGLVVTGNANISNATISNAATIGTTLQAQGGIQNTIIGNAQPAQAFFTTESVSGNSTVNGLTVNTSATIGQQLRASGGLQATPIGNEITSSGAFTAVTAALIGNIGTNHLGNTFTALTSFNGNLNGALGLAGGNSAIISELSVSGNTVSQAIFSNSTLAVASTITSASLYTGLINANNSVVVNSLNVNTTGVFGSTIYANGTITGANLTTNGSVRAGGNVIANGIIFSQSRIVADGGLQNTPIGNLTPSSAYFTTIDTNANATVNALTVNNDATIGTNLSVGANAIVGNLRTAGTILITNTTNSTGANTGALVVQGGASFEKDVYVLGNVYTSNIIAVNANTLAVQDPLLYLTANTPFPYNYDIGFFSHYDTTGSNLLHTGFVRDVDDGTWKIFSNVINEPTITIDFTGAVYDALLTGTHTVLGQIIGNSTLSVFGSATVGNLIANANISAQNLNVSGVEVVGNITVGHLTATNTAVISGTLSAPGGLQNTPIGNAIPNTAQFTTVSSSGNLTAAALTVNGSSTIGSTLSVAGNLIAGNLISQSIFAANIISPVINLNSQSVITATGNINPVAGNTYNLGNTTNYWSTLFANNLLIGNNITLGANLFSGGNINGNGLSIVGSGTLTSTLSVAGGIQNTVIGNITPTAAYFTTVNTNSNATVNGLTVNNSVTIGSTLSVVGNITAPYLIGNIIGNISGNIAAPGSNRQVLFNDNNLVSGDSGLTYNKDTSELSVNGNLDINWISAAGGAEFKLPVVIDAGLQNTAIGNVTPSFAIFTSESVSGNSTVNGLAVNTSTTIGTTLGVTGNISVATGNVFVQRFNSTSTQLASPTPGSDNGYRITLYDFNTTNQVNYGIGVENNHIWNAVDNNVEILGFKWYGNTTQIARLSGTGNLNIIGVFSASSGSFANTVNVNGNLSAGNIIANGGMTVGTSFSAFGGIQNTEIGNVTPSTATFTSVSISGNGTVNGLTVNTSATIGTTLNITGNLVAGNISTAGIFRITSTAPATSNVSGAVQISGGIGVGGNVYVGQRVGFVAANSVSAVYQVYNAATNSLDTVFE